MSGLSAVGMCGVDGMSTLSRLGLDGSPTSRFGEGYVVPGVGGVCIVYGD